MTNAPSRLWTCNRCVAPSRTNGTIEFHLRNVYRKLAIRSRTELVALLLRDGLGG